MTSRSKQTWPGTAKLTTFEVDPARNQLLSRTVNGESEEYGFDPNGNMIIDGDRRNLFDVAEPAGRGA